MDRAWLKSRAKVVLKKYYFILLIVSFVMALTAGGFGGNSGGRSGVSVRHEDRDRVYEHEFSDGSDVSRVEDVYVHGGGDGAVDRVISNIPGGGVFRFIFGLGVGLFALAFAAGAIVFAIFISFPLHVGGARIYIDCADAEHAPRIGRLAYVFRSGHLGNVALAGFLKSLYTFLWMLLFIIPGIIKSYAYSMVPYILADNPEMKASDALRLSEEMMRGHKMEYFILHVSLVGWYLLGTLAFGVGIFLVHPYRDAVVTQFYLQLRSGYLTDPVEETVIDDAGSYGRPVN